MTRKLDMEAKNGTAVNNEQRLWHGTAPDSVPNINANNFNRSYGGVNGLILRLSLSRHLHAVESASNSGDAEGT